MFSHEQLFSRPLPIEASRGGVRSLGTIGSTLPAFTGSPRRSGRVLLLGEIGEAKTLYEAAIRLNEAIPHAYYGLYRAFKAASVYRSARLMCMRAHQLDPDDALLTYAFLHYATPEIRKQKFGSFMEEHPCSIAMTVSSEHRPKCRRKWNSTKPTY